MQLMWIAWMHSNRIRLASEMTETRPPQSVSLNLVAVE